MYRLSYGTWRTGQFCPFINMTPFKTKPASAAMASVDPSISDRDSAFLQRKISEEEEQLKSKIAEMEAQLAALRLQTASLDSSLPSSSTPPPGPHLETGVPFTPALQTTLKRGKRNP